MTAAEITRRIKDEYRKYANNSNIDWAEMAGHKISASIAEEAQEVKAAEKRGKGYWSGIADIIHRQQQPAPVSPLPVEGEWKESEWVKQFMDKCYYAPHDAFERWKRYSKELQIFFDEYTSLQSLNQKLSTERDELKRVQEISNAEIKAWGNMLDAYKDENSQLKLVAAELEREVEKLKEEVRLKTSWADGNARIAVDTLEELIAERKRREETESQLKEKYQRIEELEAAVKSISESPDPFNEREMHSWYETAREIAAKALNP